MGCRRKNTLCLSLDFGMNDGTLLPSLTRLETSPSPQKHVVLKFPNKPSAAQHPSVVDQCLANEVSLGRVTGPFSAPPFQNLHVSSFRVIPKRGQSGKWHLIVDLTSPGRASVNNGIDLDEFTLHYITVDQVICLVSKLGPRALMAKFDVEAAYCNVPVHPSHCALLGMKWCSEFYMDLVLPFGLRPAPFIFNSIADIVEWILVNSYQIQTSVTWTTSLLLVLLSPSSAHRTWLLLCKFVHGLVYLCILASVWALLCCLLFWDQARFLQSSGMSSA